MKHILSPEFKYAPAAKHSDATYLREKFRQIRAEQDKASAETQQKVAGTIKPRVKARTT